MSLINEALKKAQPERPSDKPTPPPMDPSAGVQQPPKRKKNYLWGFLLAVLIVGLFSAAVSTFLVYQVLGDSDGKDAASSSTQEEASSTDSDQMWVKMAEATTSGSLAEQVQTAPEEPQPVSNETVMNESASAETFPETSEAALSKPPTPPNPAVWARLQELEIRGIMSGGNKVLIFDLSTGKTKSYQPGDILDGSLALKIASIDPSAILFEDYAGSIHTKSF
jgi:cytoskeletal protein RodZ